MLNEYDEYISRYAKSRQIDEAEERTHLIPQEVKKYYKESKQDLIVEEHLDVGCGGAK